MRPRRFYIGFPPAIWKTTRNGIEYGIGAIPLGGFVKIPGMHRPGAGRRRHRPRPGRSQDVPCSAAPTSRLRDALAAGDHDTARDSVRVLRELVDEQELDAARRRPPRARASTTSTTRSARTRTGAPPTWKRVAAIAAGPAANILLALVLFTGALHDVGRARRRRPSSASRKARRRSPPGLQAGDRIVSIDGTPVQADDISAVISGSDGQPLTVVVVARRRARDAAADARRGRTTARTGSASSSRARGCRSPRRPASRSCSPAASRARSERRSGGSSQGEGTRRHLEPGRHRPGLVRRRQAGRRELPLRARPHLALDRAPEPPAAPAARRRPHRVRDRGGRPRPRGAPGDLRARLRDRDRDRRSCSSSSASRTTSTGSPDERP